MLLDEDVIKLDGEPCSVCGMGGVGAIL